MGFTALLFWVVTQERLRGVCYLVFEFLGLLWACVFVCGLGSGSGLYLVFVVCLCGFDFSLRSLDRLMVID